jgi:hypothetical protein
VIAEDGGAVVGAGELGEAEPDDAVVEVDEAVPPDGADEVGALVEPPHATVADAKARATITPVARFVRGMWNPSFASAIVV